MNTATGFLLYLAASFALVIALLETPALQFYTGAFVIFLFMGGLFFAWLNAIRQSNKMSSSQSIPPAKKEEGELHKEENPAEPAPAAHP